MDRRDFIKKAGLGCLALPFIAMGGSPACNQATPAKGEVVMPPLYGHVHRGNPGTFGLVDAQRDIGPHQNVEVYVNGEKIPNVVAANDEEGWLEAYHRSYHPERKRVYCDVEIRWTNA